MMKTESPSDAAVVWLEAQSLAQRTEVEKADAVLLTYRQENKIDVLESQRKTVEKRPNGFQ